MTHPRLPSLETIRSSLSYDPETGHFTWLRSGRGGQKGVGSRAGYLRKDGYRSIKCKSGDLPIREQRLAWLLMTGEWPTLTIDHINRIRDDNRWCNLREATMHQQQANMSLNRNSKTGLRGVRIGNDGKYYAALNTRDGPKLHPKCLRLGAFDTIAEAKAAYDAAAKARWGDRYIPQEIP